MTDQELAQQCSAFFALLAELKRQQHQAEPDTVADHLRTLADCALNAVQQGQTAKALQAILAVKQIATALKPVLQQQAAGEMRVTKLLEDNIMEAMVLRKQNYEMQLLLATQNGMEKTAVDIRGWLHTLDEFFFAAIGDLDAEHASA